MSLGPAPGSITSLFCWPVAVHVYAGPRSLPRGSRLQVFSALGLPGLSPYWFFSCWCGAPWLPPRLFLCGRSRCRTWPRCHSCPRTSLRVALHFTPPPRKRACPHALIISVLMICVQNSSRMQGAETLLGNGSLPFLDYLQNVLFKLWNGVWCW